jgi:hypothetical protein
MTNSKITYQSIASIVLSQPETFSRQGFVTASYRTSRGRKCGPYYRLAYRDQQNRQRSIYLGRSEELAGLVQSLLDKLKTPLRHRRECHRIRVALLANLRTHKKHWKDDLAACGLYLKGFSVRGWRALHPANKLKGGRNMDNSFSSSVSKQKNMPPKTTVKVDIDLSGKGYIPRSDVTDMRLKIHLANRLDTSGRAIHGFYLYFLYFRPTYPTISCRQSGETQGGRCQKCASSFGLSS